MNRRNLFKLIAGAACAAALEITGVAPLLPKAAKWAVNPEWLNASYEDVVIMHKTVEGHGYVLRCRREAGSPFLSETLNRSNALPDSLVVLNDAHPNRYTFVGGKYLPVPKYTLEPEPQ